MVIIHYYHKTIKKRQYRRLAIWLMNREANSEMIVSTAVTGNLYSALNSQVRTVSISLTLAVCPAAGNRIESYLKNFRQAA